MSKTKQAPPQAKEEVDPNERDPRVDEYAFEVFQSLGYKNPLPDKLAEAYLDLKRTRDMLSSGRLSMEGFATVIELFKLRSKIG